MTKTYLTYSRDIGDFKHDLTELSQNGLSGLRIISKGKTAEEFICRLEEILEYSGKNNLNLELLIDLPGEKALVGNLGDGLKIEKGQRYILCNERSGLRENEIPTVNFLGRIDRKKVWADDIISIADGEVELKIVEIRETGVECVALNSFFLTSGRSFNIKGNKLPASPLSGNDHKLLAKIESHELSKTAKILVSFITKASQIKLVKDLLPDSKIIAKLEDVIPVDDLEEIINISDAIMLGRGDLTDTAQMSRLFPFQKLVIDKCKLLDRELIIATGIFGALKNDGKPSISDIFDFGFLKSQGVSSFLIAGSNAHYYPFETLNLITNFDDL